MLKASRKAILLSTIIGLTGGAVTGHGIYLSAKASFSQYLLEAAWEESVKEGHAIAPWPWADTKPLARIEFKQQKQTFIIMEGSSGRTLAFAPGHLTGSSLPGRGGHTIISAHRDTHFSVLEKSAISDVLILETLDNRKHFYQISAINIIDTRSEHLILEPEKGLLTLITCYPFDAIHAGSPFRYRVDAILINNPVKPL
ncbi:MAG: class GN sortase [Gammaproteobacteria bacterium]|nr:class GN sortase [Gammaproteobacteria bacterium]